MGALYRKISKENIKFSFYFTKYAKKYAKNQSLDSAIW